MSRLEVDAYGHRPGHPVAGRDVIEVVTAAEALGVTPPTVRAWIGNDTLDGFWWLPGGAKRYRWRVYADAVPKPGNRAGALGARRRGAAPQPIGVTYAALVAKVDGLTATVAALAERVKALSPSAIAELNAERVRRVELEEALRALAEADEHLVAAAQARDAAHARTADAVAVLRAHALSARHPRFVPTDRSGSRQ